MSKTREERIAYLSSLLQREPDDPFSYYTIALEYAAMKEYQIAADFLETVLRLDPRYVPAYHQLALVCIQLEQTEKALTHLKTGMEIAKQNGDSHAFKEMLSLSDDLI